MCFSQMTKEFEYFSCVHWRRQWQPTPVLFPGNSHGRRSLVSYSPWGLEELDTTERLPFHFSLSCIGEGNGNPLQCSCLENPRDGGTWRATIYGIAQSRTQLKQLSSSNSSSITKSGSKLWMPPNEVIGRAIIIDEVFLLRTLTLNQV